MSADRVIVVGGGLFGSTIAAALVHQGRKVVVFDDCRPMNGTTPSGFLMKPSWFDGMGKEVHVPALKLLHELYDVKKLSFQIWPIGKATEVYRLGVENPQHKLDVRLERVIQVYPDGVETVETGRHTGYDAVIIATGVWANELVGAVPGLHGKTGVSFIVKSKVPHNVIRPWAPYKQIVAYNHPVDGDSWVGDGSAIKAENWTSEREQQCWDRCSRVYESPDPKPLRLVGIRPMVKNAKPCFLEKCGPYWVCTGGGKNGSIAAGWAAHRLQELL